MYSEILENAKRLGQFDPATMGNVSNVGLMAKKAEEYGSHDKTFTAPADGVIRVVDDTGTEFAPGNSYLERLERQGSIQGGGYGITDYLAGISVQDGR